MNRWKKKVPVDEGDKFEVKVTVGEEECTYSNMSLDDFEASQEPKKKNFGDDKIFGNAYNTGDTTVSHHTEIRIKTDYMMKFLGDVHDADDHALRKDLLKKTYEVFRQSQWKDLSLDKKFAKDLLPYIFNDLFVGLIAVKADSTAVERFIAITEFMDTGYDKMYEAAGTKIKEQLIRELEGRFKILNKKRIQRLF